MRKTKKEQIKQLRKMFAQVEIEFPDKSTEFLIEITKDRARQWGLKVETDSIVEALTSGEDAPFKEIKS